MHPGNFERSKSEAELLCPAGGGAIVEGVGSRDERVGPDAAQVAVAPAAIVTTAQSAPRTTADTASIQVTEQCC